MCTVSYLPTDKGFILTSNRDEAPFRKDTDVVKRDIAGQNVLFPVDPVSGGSWFAVSDAGTVAALLNGAYKTFKPSAGYTYSRGQVLLDAFRISDPVEFARKTDFSNTAPFTLIVMRANRIHQIIWDGTHTLHLELYPHQRHFWSSVTLYPAEVRKWRAELFDRWYKETPSFSQEDIMTFHRYGGQGDAENDFVMNRDEVVRTLTITSAEHTGDRIVLRHMNVVTDDKPEFRQTLDISPASVS